MSNSDHDARVAACIEQHTRQVIKKLQDDLEKTFLRGNGWSRVPEEVRCERCGAGKNWVHECRACAETSRHPCPAKELS